MTLSDTIKQTNKNIEDIREFLKYIENNNNDHEKGVNAETRTLDDIENSLLFLRDYNRVTNDLVGVIKEYERNC